MRRTGGSVRRDDTEGQPVARRERPADAAGDVRRPAAEHERRGNAAVHGDIGARTAAPFAEAQDRTGTRGARHARRECGAVERRAEIGARGHDPGIVLEAQLGSPERHLERGRRRIVAERGVGGIMGDDVHRACDRHAERLMPPAPPVLHRGEQPR